MNLEELQEAVDSAIQPAFRGRLLSRGLARSMIWREGNLPAGAPEFAPTLTYDLLSYGDALLSLAMRVRERNGDRGLARAAFEHAGEAIEAVVSNGEPRHPQRGFLRLLSASAFHLGRLSARAYSMLVTNVDDENLSRIEKALALLILRSLDSLENNIATWRLDGQGSDQQLIERIATWIDSADENEGGVDDISPLDAAIDDAVSDTFFTGLGYFLSALQTGERALVEAAKAELQNGLAQCSTLNLIPQWWCFRLADHLIDDLWSSSFHEILPGNLPNGDGPSWHDLRDLYIASLHRRRRAEIELWPSQLNAALRSVDASDDLVVSLPTSAGKTRIAELCILRCLSEGKRVVFVTPLRALSAQTEVSLQRTFGPLGKRISALYGSIGTSSFEDDALKERDIVVATPEKLDFALRSDPTIIDDVGLIVLDEGHMIGLGEREVRYEVQIQRLLKRVDADQRRIVCLSAILPDGDQFDDFVSWLRRDKEGGSVTSDWRPTRIRFGEVLWRGDHARLDVRVEDEATFVPRFFGQRVPTQGQRTDLFPRDQRELVLATAWRLVEDGQSALIYCPERRSVEPYARAIQDLSERGFLESVLTVDQQVINSALTIGREWLGNDHPILKCLELGVAIHHGALPTPFRKEIERLLRDGALKITVSSPTLAQGLNLTATAVLMHDIEHFRDGRRKVIKASNFKNVIGRAGRAFVDVEGLVVFPIFGNQTTKRRKWRELIDSIAGQEMESGLVRLVVEFLARMNEALGEPDIADLQEYVLNNAVAWEFSVLEDEDEDAQEQAKREWDEYLSLLDTAVLSLLGEQDLAIDGIALQLDNILSSSLWQRRLAHHTQETQDLLNAGLVSRAQVIWSNSTARQRRGYFLAGVGLSTGKQLDAIAQQANQLLIQANGALLNQEQDIFIESIVNIAEILFEIHPFTPNPFPADWRDVLRRWLRGEPIAQEGAAVNADTLRFIENGLVYKLPWGLEAIRVRAQANGELGAMTIDDFEVGVAVPAVETGTTNRSAAILMQAGFTSRLAAIKVVDETDAAFTNSFELNGWLESDAIMALNEDINWPTPESRVLWDEFRAGFIPSEKRIWSVKSGEVPVSWADGISPPAPGEMIMLRISNGELPLVMSAAFNILGELPIMFATVPKGLFRAFVGDEPDSVTFQYFGPDDLALEAL